jgi:hypothetical protein
MHISILLTISFVMIYLISAAPIGTGRLRGTFGTCPVQIGEYTYVVDTYIEPLTYANLRGAHSYTNNSHDEFGRIHPQNKSASVILMVKTSSHSI